MGEQSKNNAGRTNWIDTARGYGIVLVIIGHIMKEDTAWQSGTLGFIYSFHMPLFFIISGYLLNVMKYSFKDFGKKRVKTLLYPYFWLGMLIIAINWCFFCFGSFSGMIDYLRQWFIQIRFHVIWYLLCLFWAEIILYLIVRLTKDNIFLSGMICVLFAICGLVYDYLGGTELFWNIDLYPIATFYLFVGYVLRRVKLRWDWYFLPISMSINAVCILLNQMISGENLELFRMQYGCFPITLIGSIAGVYMVFWISYWKQVKWITYIGKNSMLYFGLHQATTVVGCEMLFTALKAYPDGSNVLYAFGYVIAVTAFTIVVFTLFQKLIDRKKRVKCI